MAWAISGTLWCDKCGQQPESTRGIGCRPRTVSAWVKAAREDGWQVSAKTGEAVCWDCLPGGGQ